jgi:hypothetical protein
VNMDSGILETTTYRSQFFFGGEIE